MNYQAGKIETRLFHREIVQAILAETPLLSPLSAARPTLRFLSLFCLENYPVIEFPVCGG